MNILTASRLNSLSRSHDAADLERALEIQAGIAGLTAAELNFPQHVTNPDDGRLIQRARSLGLAVTALNLRFDPREFRRGAFCHPDGDVRIRAIQVAQDAVRCAQSHEIGHVILWLGPDGFDYPFEMDYSRALEWATEGVRQVAELDVSIKVSIEYKPSEPRARSLIRGMGDALLLARDSSCPNVGVTLDFCHSLMAGESPAVEAARALYEGRLFGLHLNDGHGLGDDGLMVGAIHWTETVELLTLLERANWSGTIYFDTFPDQVNAVDECRANVERLERMLRIAARLGAEPTGEGDPSAIQSRLLTAQQP